MAKLNCRIDESKSLLNLGDRFGDYIVIRLLGTGGMGMVYLLRSLSGDLYAAKIMSPTAARRHDLRKRFVDEAEFAMGFRHRNLVSVYDVGEDPDTGLCYIIMEYLPGGSLADQLAKKGAFPVAAAMSIAVQLAIVLDAAHKRGLVHRDIKPDNILFAADGTPKLADLGIAKFEGRNTAITTTGMVIGTPAYMAPEQMIDSRNVDARADIYALGIVLYEMLSGKRVNAGITAVELLSKAIKGEPLLDVQKLCPNMPDAIAYVLSFMCAPKPENRPQTAIAAAQLLRKATTGRLVLPRKSLRAFSAAMRINVGQVLKYAIVVFVTALLSTMLANMFLTRSIREWRIASNSMDAARPTTVIGRTVVATNLVERMIVVTNTVSRVVIENDRSVPQGSEGENAKDAELTQDEFSFRPPAPKFKMAVNEKSLDWFSLDDGLLPKYAIRVCHDLSHGGFPGTNQIFYAKFLAGKNGFAFKPCWHELARENLDSVNVLVLPSSPAQILHGEGERAAIEKFLSRGGTVIAFVGSNENNIWSMNKFFGRYGLEVFMMDERASKVKELRDARRAATPICVAAKGLRPELYLHTFAAPVSDVSAREWSSMVTAGAERRTVLAARRVGKGNLIYASSGWYFYGGRNRSLMTSDDNKRLWMGIFMSAARNLPVRESMPIGERSVTDTSVMLSAGPITIYSSERWKENAYKLRDIVRQALPHLERHCGRVLDPADMEHTKFVLTGTSIWGYVDAGPKTLVTSATFRGFPDKIGYFSQFVFERMISGVIGDNSISLSGYIANLALADIGLSGEMASRIDEGKRLDPDFSKYVLTGESLVLDKKGGKVENGRRAIIVAKNFSALEEIRSRHPNFISAYLERKRKIFGRFTRSQSVGILTDITGEDCFKVFGKYGAICSSKDVAIVPERLNARAASQNVAAESVGAKDGFPVDDSPVVLNGPCGLVVRALPGCGKAARRLLADLEGIWLPAAMKFYGDPCAGKKPGKRFVVTLERKKGAKCLSYRPGFRDWKYSLPPEGDVFEMSLGYLSSAILTRVSEPTWTDFAFYVNYFLNEALGKGVDAATKVKDDIEKGRTAEGKSRKDYSSLGEFQWATQMKRRWKLWKAFEEVRAKDQEFMLKYCNIKNRRFDERNIQEKITWRQMAELMGEAVGFDVMEIFVRNGVDIESPTKNVPKMAFEAKRLYGKDSTRVD